MNAPLHPNEEEIGKLGREVDAYLAFWEIARKTNFEPNIDDFENIVAPLKPKGVFFN